MAADVRELVGRAPDEAEYRALRDHLDTGAPLPDAELFATIEERPRTILGVPFDPGAETWRAFMERLFHTMMGATLRHTRTLCDAGVDLQIMPQGVTAPRLTKGHPGALQAALALDLPVVPVGINGFPQGWGAGRALPMGGEVRIRVGPAFRPEPIEGHTPFLPSSERTHADAIEAGTAAMMARVAALLDPEHAPADDGEEQLDVTGVARFV
jgi:1-acyl-sn-glycerol-3-phosphate acyltransferase